MNTNNINSVGSENFGLSPRQYEVFIMISNGYTNKEIATALVISPETVKTHIKNVYRRVNIGKRSEATELVRLA